MIDKYAPASGGFAARCRRMNAVKPKRRRAGLLPALLLLLALALGACRVQPAKSQLLTLDGQPWEGGSLSPEAGDGLRVYITLDGAPLADLPFGEAHTVAIRQPEGENIVAITGDAVYMARADCDNQDCVNMGEVTRENLEMRVMGGFIICLPHRVSVEVRGD